MATVPQTELEQRTSEYIQFVRDFALNLDRDFTFASKRKEFALFILDKDVTLEFEV